MATQRRARVVASTPAGRDTTHLELEMVGEAELGFAGGQYIIIDGEQTLPNGKALKRAYSMMSDDRAQARFELAVMSLPGGPGSTFMQGLAPGREIGFSGPWGKLYPREDASGGTLILATDTGITSALGLIRSRRMAPLLGETAFIWLRTEPDYFLSEAFVRARMPAGIGFVRVGLCKAAGDVARISEARGLVQELGGPAAFGQGFISGDGAVNYALLDDLTAAGLPVTRENVESFFNMPKKSAAT